MVTIIYAWFTNHLSSACMLHFAKLSAIDKNMNFLLSKLPSLVSHMHSSEDFSQCLFIFSYHAGWVLQASSRDSKSYCFIILTPSFGDVSVFTAISSYFRLRYTSALRQMNLKIPWWTSPSSQKPRCSSGTASQHSPRSSEDREKKKICLLLLSI